ncbi:MAG: DoxX family protein [Gammaproteobacteria bacterium]|nr:MAG: DoxX family protein [Gammaproteobacteria bacterium]
MKNLYVNALNVTLGWPERVASYIQWLGPLFARIVVGEIFLVSGWGKLQTLEQVTENFVSWGIPFPHILTPFTSGAEFICGILLIVGLFTRISSGVLGVIMIVAIKSALWDQVDSLDTLLGFSETAYLAIFLWLAIAGAGKISIDYWLTKK